MQKLLIALVIIGWSWLAVAKWQQHVRRADVLMWAEAAYQSSAIDHGGQCSFALDVCKSNQQFSLDAVAKAYDGAWDSAHLPTVK